jgi:ABC-type glycerol-3-phosphate transport system substrate-binding protein
MKRIISVLLLCAFFLTACGTVKQANQGGSSVEGEETVLTIGCKDGRALPQELVALAEAQGYTLEPVYYSQEGTAGRWEALEEELAAGDGPDILQDSNFGLGPEHPEKDVYFADLGPFLEADPTLGWDSLVPVIRETYAPEGKLYHVTDSFYVDTVIARESSGMEQFQYETLADLIDTYGPENVELWTQSLSGALDSWVIQETVNLETGKLSFTGTAFRQALDCYQRLRTAAPAEEVFFQEGLLYYGTISSFYDLQFYRAAFGEAVTLAGTPGQTGILRGSTAYSINQNSTKKEAAWAVLSQLLQPEYQLEHTGGFPTNQVALAQLAQAVQGQGPTEDQWPAVAFPLEVTLGPVSETDVMTLLTWLETAELRPAGMYGTLWRQANSLLLQALEAQPQGNAEALAAWMEDAYEREDAE